MAFTVIVCDMYRLQNVNSSSSTYQKNGTQLLGRFARHNGYCAEILFKPPSFSTLPANITITSVDMSYNVTANNIVPTTNGYVKVFNEDKGTWTDTGSAPIYSTFAASSWATTLITSSVLMDSNTALDAYVLSSTPEFTTVVTDWVNGNNQNGCILSLNCSYFASVLSIDQIAIQINYTVNASNKNNFFYYYNRHRK